MRIREHGGVAPLLLLDLDGTVLDGGGLPAAMRATCEGLADGLPGVPAEALRAANTAAWSRLWPEVEADYMLGGRSGDDIGRVVWRATLVACGVRGDDAVDRAIALWEQAERASFRPFDDVLPLLQECERRGDRVGMVTNGAASVQRDKLRTMGLADRFDPLVISSEAGVKKPDPAIFEVALAAAGASAADTWFVGDNLWHDVPGAVEAGIHAIWLDRDGATPAPDAPRPDRVVRSLTELLEPR